MCIWTLSPWVCCTGFHPSLTQQKTINMTFADLFPIFSASLVSIPNPNSDLTSLQGKGRQKLIGFAHLKCPSDERKITFNANTAKGN